MRFKASVPQDMFQPFVPAFVQNTTLQTYKHTNIQTYKYTNIQTYKYTNKQIYK